MLDKVELARLTQYYLRLEKEREARERKIEDRDGTVRLDISHESVTNPVEEDEISKKAEEIKQKLDSGTYQVSSHKVLEGLEKFFNLY
ncbi:hypothetical protein Thal_0144 [Thermocrinis albus DSM 14484]|uniref:Uncharacterized protein n=1 Tax=Thermocrinis albus (strain DSM 14484 / JCM 11386 / HI 11/12) TaxID=638303 RepID=D3SNP3_THEAH|nr:flagellar biosynthesis anti-sigma factor FlgM [Thermocrinis albus]ADC88780.1 hypothetical protein Thal_0144 [Thermocrinis albus DSM 14484]